jgi:signal transduction histidine kinase
VSRNCSPVRANAHGLKEVLLALVSNARDAMPDGGRLGLSARPTNGPDGTTTVKLTLQAWPPADDGPAA